MEPKSLKILTLPGIRKWSTIIIQRSKMAHITIKTAEIINLIKKTPLAKYIINLRAHRGNILGSIKLKKMLPSINFSLGYQNFKAGLLTLKIHVGLFTIIGLLFFRNKMDGIKLSYPYIEVNTRKFLPELEVQKIVHAGDNYHLITKIE
jgi:hypothetical protein|tara:strand:- start:154 stop:600 length:447 start_codon:yes stop_codon:yes gene_type:complete